MKVTEVQIREKSDSPSGRQYRIKYRMPGKSPEEHVLTATEQARPELLAAWMELSKFAGEQCRMDQGGGIAAETLKTAVVEDGTACQVTGWRMVKPGGGIIR